MSIEEQTERQPQPPASIRADGGVCRYCNAMLDVLHIDDCVKECNGGGIHLIGWNGQLRIPGI